MPDTIDHERPLNHYQQLMVRYAQLTPYNAVHSISFADDPPNMEKLYQVINEVIHQLSLGNPSFSEDKKRVTYTPLNEALTVGHRITSLSQHVEKEMNYSFSVGEFPMRFFLIQSQSELFFSLTYNHWIADAYAISALMEAIFDRLQGRSSTQLTTLCPRMDTCFPFALIRDTAFYRCFLVLKIVRQFSRVYRTEVSREDDAVCGSVFHIFGKEVLTNIIVYCKTKKISVNDLFIAILAKQFGQLTQAKRLSLQKKFLKPRRDRIVIGVISNIRKFSQQSLDKCFSLFLGFFHLSFKAPENYTINELAHRIAATTSRYKRTKKAVKNTLLFKVQRDIWDKKKNMHSKFRWFRKNTPMTVGVSNLDLSHNALALHTNIHYYLRFSPTAMICPIVFNLTSFNSYLSLGINFRKASYSAEQVEMLKEQFVKAIYDITNREV